MGRKAGFFVLTLIFILSAVCFSHAAEPQIKLKFAMFIPPVNKNAILFDKFCQDINKKTNGKVEISYYPGGTLLTAPKMAAGVATGIADIGFAHCAYSRGRFPVMEAMELPLGFPNGWVGTHVANDFFEKVRPKEWAEYHPLMFGSSPANIVQTLSKPVRTLEEFKGLKIRGTGRIGDIVKALGGTPVPIEMVDLYESLRRGVIDGNLGPLEQVKGFKTGELLKHVTASWKVGSVFAFYVVMNGRKWDNLPADVKKVFDETGKEYVEKWSVQMNEMEIEGRDFLISQGGQVLSMSDSEAAKWIKAAEPVIVDYKKDLVSKGYKETEIESWMSFIKERIEHWKGEEKSLKIATPYQY